MSACCRRSLVPPAATSSRICRMVILCLLLCRSVPAAVPYMPLCRAASHPRSCNGAFPDVPWMRFGVGFWPKSVVTEHPRENNGQAFAVPRRFRHSIKGRPPHCNRVYMSVAEGLLHCVRIRKKGIRKDTPGMETGDPGGIQTHDLQNRNLTLYSAKLRNHSAAKVLN